jgi:hypothetical protein
MATIKAYTDIEQSKKLAEILPIESADMRFCFSHTLGGRITGHYPMIGREPSLGTIPCWSLSALLRLIPKFNMFKRTIGYKIETVNHSIDKARDPIDAAFEMVVWLKENGKI